MSGTTISIESKNPSIIVDGRTFIPVTVVVPPSPNAIIGPEGPQGPQGPEGIQGLIGPQGVQGLSSFSPYLQSITLTMDHITLKKVILDREPVDGIIWLNPHGGIQQRQNIDYRHLSGEVNWEGLGLDGFLEVDEKFDLFYFTA